MGKDKSTDDIITEKEYTIRMKDASTLPEDDSPGDSELDAGLEFEMGLEFIPDADSELPVQPIPKHPIKDLPESASVISSSQPSPWMDQDKSSSQN